MKRKWLAYFLLFLVAIMAGSSFTVYHSVKKAAIMMHTPLLKNTVKNQERNLPLREEKPFSILLLGVDQQEGTKGRSDTMIILAVNPKADTIKMLSIPRDTRTEIIGKNKDDKINHAYAFGGTEMAVATVENFLGIPVQYYMKVNMSGFEEVIKTIGGISVHNDLEFTSGGVHFSKGEIKLNGTDALGFSRMRYEDPRGDFGRQARQRQVVQGIIKKIATPSSIIHYEKVLRALEKNIQTNLTFNDLLKLQKTYKVSNKSIEQLELKGSPAEINKIYYYTVSETEKERIRIDLTSYLAYK